MPTQVHADPAQAGVTNGRATFPTVAVVGAGLFVGAAVMMRVWRHTATATAARAAEERSTALATYLRDHLSGSDTAIRVVERLRRTHAGKSEGRLFGSLFEDLQREREVVRALLADIGASTLSAKRLMSGAGGMLLAPASGGDRGDRNELALLRTLEALAIGVQGKRLLWRAMQDVEPEFTSVSRSRLSELETLAVRQWEALDERRRAVGRATFATG